MKTNERIPPLFGYSVKLSRLSEEDGGGWLAEVPQLEGCFSDGETPDEALTNVQDAIKVWIEAVRKDGHPIPAPEFYTESEYSGKFTLRIPKSLHKFLALQAEREGISLNQYLASLISFNAASRAFKDQNEISDNPIRDDKNNDKNAVISFQKIVLPLPQEKFRVSNPYTLESKRGKRAALTLDRGDFNE